MIRDLLFGFGFLSLGTLIGMLVMALCIAAREGGDQQ
jgi:hypothetical protein